MNIDGENATAFDDSISMPCNRSSPTIPTIRARTSSEMASYIDGGSLPYSSHRPSNSFIRGGSSFLIETAISDAIDMIHCLYLCSNSSLSRSSDIYFGYGAGWVMKISQIRFCSVLRGQAARSDYLKKQTPTQPSPPSPQQRRSVVSPVLSIVS